MLSRYPKAHDKHPLGVIAPAAQERYNSICLMSVYGDPQTGAWFHAEYQKTGKKLNMGKSCLRIKKAEDLPLDLVGQVVARTEVEDFIEMYKGSRNRS